MIFESPSYTITMVASKHVVFNVNDFEGKELSTDDIEIIKRVAKVFNQAYIRFLDLQQAEIQAQKTQIELSLERIRSQVTAMQASSDLFDIVVTMRDEFLSLGHEADYFWHMNWAKDNYEMSMTAEDGGRLGMVITVPKFVHEQMEDLHQWEKSNSPYFVLALNGKDAWDYIDKMNTYGKYKLVDPHAPTEEDILHIGGLTFIMARTTHGEIGFSLAGKIDNPPQASIDILVRFASVFDLAYKRFEDLKKAEAQTRETQIELALEKVRSRSMAMQKSDELSDAAEILYKEFYKLGVTPFSCGYLINNDTEKQWNVWMTDANDESFKSFWTLPYNADQHIKDRYENWQKKKPFHSTELKGDANIKHHKIIAKYAPWKKSSLKDLPDCLVLSSANFKYGHLLIVTGEALSEEIQSILIRFAKVFEQTYTRFLDLRKAELQTRETQIELALEKVRSRTMAMQHSDELQEASFLLDQQVRALGIKTWGCAFNIYGENESTEWFGNEAGVLHTYTVPREGIFKDYYDKGQKGETLVIQEFSGDDCVAHYEYMSSLPVIGDVLKTLKETNHGFPTYQIDHVVYFKYGYLLFITREHVPDSHAIFKRFAKVFEQTYTRFLDLQKAETQAREAQIEATLERVRSRSMAMHKSEEIGDVAFVLFEQLKSLGGELWGTGFGFCKTDSDVDEFWFANEKGIMPHLKIPNTKDSAHKKMYQGWKKNLDLFSIEKGGKELKDHYKYMLTVPDVQPIFQGMLNEGIAFPTWQKWHAAYFKYGYMLVITTEPYPNETIFKRFAKVFEQAYTRFLDLQKAEAQAKEAQIEAALERVRSRSMAMHQTKELQEVIHTVHQELLRLNIGIDGGSFIIVNEDIDEELFIWGSGGTTDTAMETKIPYTKNLIYTNLLQYVKNGNGLYTEEFTHEEKTKFFSFLLKQKPWSDLSKKEKSKTLNTSGGYSRSFYVSENTTLLVVNHKGKTFAPNENAILERFAKVFEQAYTRFLDLKKAEAQAREAQIEVAVERVRAEAMAMHTTTDFEKVTQQLLNQVQNLELDGFTGASIGLRDENDYFTWWDFSSPGNIGDPKSQLSTYNAHDYQLLGTELLDELKKGKNYMVFEYDLKRLNKAVREWGDINPAIAAEFKKAITEGNLTHQWNPCGRLANGLLAFDMVQPPDEDVKNIVIKMTHAFEQAYIRFQDLQKAEAQAREAQIETALEKVRSRTMAMQHSEELPEAANVLFTEVQNLGIPAWSCGYNILSEDKKSSTCIMSSEGEIQSPFILPLTEHKSLKPWHNAILNNEQFFVYEQGDKDLEEHYDYMQSLPELQDTFKQLRDANITLPTFQVNHLAKFTNGFLLFITYERVPEAHEIFQRFAKVFEQTYTRFLDLQKAEAQTRKAQIEAALERTRTQSMLMQRSEEIDATSKVFHEQLQLLGIETEFSYVWLPDEANNEHQFWVAWNLNGKQNTSTQSKAIVYPLDKSEPYTAKCFKDWESGVPVHIHHIKPKEVTTFFMAWEELLKDAKNLTPKYFSNGLYYAEAFMKYGCFGINIKRAITEEENQILQRFSVEFERTYTRFLDLKKAEAQARNAQIEASLERVRAKAMAMHDSNELDEVLSVLCEQFDVLGIVPMSTHMTVLDFENNTFTFRETGKFGNRSFGEQTVALDAMDNWKETVDKWKADKATAINKLHFPKEQLSTVWDVFHESFASMPKDSRITPKDYPDGIYHTAGKHPFGYIGMNQVRPATEEEEQIVIKFANEFGMAYQRFLDLQKAEAQAREAQIEAALEKVRSRSLAMHNANELKDVVVVIVEKLKELGVILDANGVTLCTYFPDSKDVLHWIASPDFSHVGKYLLPYFDHVIFKDAWQSKESGEAYFSKSYSVEKKNSFFEHAFEHSDYKYFPEKVKEWIFNNDKHVLSFAWQKNSAILIPSNTGVLPTDSEKEILIRFSKVFEQAYIRFMDLKKAEAQTREAHIEAGLEKVRSRSLAMDGSNEMQDVANEIFYQMQALGLQMDAVGMSGEMDATKDYDVWIGGSTFKKPLTIPHSKATKVQRDYNIINANRDELFTRTYTGAIKKEYIDYLLAANSFPKKLEKIMVESDAFTTSISYSKSSGIQIVRYSEEPYTDEENQILIRFAKVFEQAYVRFRDIEIKEEQSSALLAEKKLLEKTLSNLQATQKQLIQSEKMASLGELTAGIAHEIQNPLNFVNNFSEVSKELLDEMLEEMENGDMEEVKAIMDDVIQNLEKINHHGKRADGIVKGMLQHSRASGDKKEPTNINALADEYLRLAYHGLRAKDKSFNAQLETDYDDSIKTVNIVPQDIGRVVLNLFTNAFYAVGEKKSNSKNKAYKPTVSVKTEKLKDKVIISVKDNGNGIPKHIIDKIYQPFFTTKPTGKGTGLGLSMSFDIVKAHNGELEVETEEGESTTFTIQLPLNG
ncbi:sensor histidine kinase [Winogradskyella pulchriflava]|uniref:histidine kinase n=2 Tax=Winogradskyella pulchriflava TaxID=1110688 RepID=A0ABV6QCR8_9FLAO